jgi:hypothetical protein
MTLCVVRKISRNSSGVSVAANRLKYSSERWLNSFCKILESVQEVSKRR